MCQAKTTGNLTVAPTQNHRQPDGGAHACFAGLATFGDKKNLRIEINIFFDDRN